MKRILTLLFSSIVVMFFLASSHAQEVEKGKIPEAQLVSSYKKLDWGAVIWDEAEAVAQLKSGEPTLWIDTRPESFFTKGTVRGAILMPYNKQGEDGNDMTADTLAKAVADSGIDKATGKIVMFCQGPKCHRSYNGTFMAC